MFDKSGKTESADTTSRNAAPASVASGTATTIGSSVKIKGEVMGGEDLIIQGSVEGTINLKDHSVSIGEQGRIQANVYAKNISVQGELTGDLQGTEKVTIARSGKVKGNITAPRVVLEDGATFKGSIDMEAKPAATPASAPAANNSPAKAKTA